MARFVVAPSSSLALASVAPAHTASAGDSQEVRLVSVTADHRDHPGVRRGAVGRVGDAVLAESVMSYPWTHQPWSDTWVYTCAGCEQEFQVSTRFRSWSPRLLFG